LLPSTAAIWSPNVRIAAPVRVPTSTMAAGAGRSSVASTRASAMTSRPSASMFITSTVLPPRMVSTSPSRVADPEGMLSVHISQAVTAVWHSRSRKAVIAPRISPAPDMSTFIVAWTASLGFKLIPPESYITPLPTRARGPAGPPGRPPASRGR
jgi:hypothetical protein